jgi:hypothetical protein
MRSVNLALISRYLFMMVCDAYRIVIDCSDGMYLLRFEVDTGNVFR